jgi:hypothetical protein
VTGAPGTQLSQVLVSGAAFVRSGAFRVMD